MSDFTRGAIVRGNQEAAQQDLLRGRRKRGIITSQKPRDGLVTVHWNGGGAYEVWHIDLLEIIDRRNAHSKTRSCAAKSSSRDRSTA